LEEEILKACNLLAS